MSKLQTYQYTVHLVVQYEVRVSFYYHCLKDNRRRLEFQYTVLVINPWTDVLSISTVYHRLADRRKTLYPSSRYKQTSMEDGLGAFQEIFSPCPPLSSISIILLPCSLIQMSFDKAAHQEISAVPLIFICGHQMVQEIVNIGS